ncbi:MAG TPA: hypothetical protein VHE57_08310 [Mycobacteriales bacterium]|nr:hypothetical protein [Mycobacteriales bacterium]
MSSLLYPVGPLPPRVYWVRRLLVLGVPLIVILIIAVSCSGGGGKPAQSAGGTTASTTPTTTATSAANEACVPGDLAAELSTSAPGSIYPLGAAPEFTATITNVSSTTCKFTSTTTNETWKVITGPTTFWTTAGCPRTDSSFTKKLDPQDKLQIKISWDGKQLDPGCKSGDPAPAGTYHLHAKLDGVKAQQVTFHFHANTG